MIKSLSPYYKNIPWSSPSGGGTPDKYILNIYIWNSLKSVVPGVPSYEIENINPLGRTGITKVDISKYVNSILNTDVVTNTTTSLNNGNSLVWVKTEVIYYIAGVAQSPELVEIESAIKGYGYGLEGENPTLNNNDLTTRIEQKVSKDSVYLFPFLASETVSTVIKIQSENVTKTLTKTATTSSIELAQSCYIKVSEFYPDEWIEIYKDDVLINTLLITEEPRYSPIDVVFLNKEGALQTLTFFKEKIESLKTESETYESSSGQPLDGVHQFKNYNVNGKTSFSVNSGFVKEDNNEIFKQLFLSSLIWQIKDNVYIPLNIESKSLEYKSRQKDRLINYKVNFSYSFNEINNI